MKKPKNKITLAQLLKCRKNGDILVKKQHQDKPLSREQIQQLRDELWDLYNNLPIRWISIES